MYLDDFIEEKYKSYDDVNLYYDGFLDYGKNENLKDYINEFALYDKIKSISDELYFDYEIDNESLYSNNNNENAITVGAPTFISNGQFYEYVEIAKKPDSTVQPEINYDSRYIKIGGEYRAKDANRVYEITFTLKDPSTMSWSDGYDGATRTLRWKIVE